MNCSAEFEDDETRCEICGAERRKEHSGTFSLPSLLPEAEPPLPAAHDELRGRTPPLGVAPVDAPTRVERHVSERSLAALRPLSTPMPMVVPTPRNVEVEVNLDEPSWATRTSARPVPAPIVNATPLLTGGRGWLRGALVVVVLCLGAGAVVGWLLSQPEPPTADEVRAQKRD